MAPNLTYARRKLQNLCVRCESPVAGTIHCQNCVASEKLKHRKQRKRRRAAKLCQWCGTKPTDGCWYCEGCKQVLKSNREKAREIILQALGGECVYCGSKTNLQIDHKVPLKRTRKNNPGGTSTINNIRTGRLQLHEVQACCKSCNIAKSTMLDTEFKSWVRKVYEYSCAV